MSISMAMDVSVDTNHLQEEVSLNLHQFLIDSCPSRTGLVGQIERATHFDINGNQRIG